MNTNFNIEAFLDLRNYASRLSDGIDVEVVF